MTYTCTTLIDGRTFVEAPRWHEGRLWFSELYTFSVWSAQPDGSDLRLEATVPEQPSGIAWLSDGRLLIASMRDRKLLRRELSGTQLWRELKLINQLGVTRGQLASSRS